MKLQEHEIESASGEYTRKVWLVPGVGDGPKRLCIFLDAEYYLDRMDTVSTLGNLALPATAFLFVSHVDGEARHYDYTCNPRYSQFIAEDVAAWVKTRVGGISDRGNLICGLSLSGLASAHMALTYPDAFSAALCQSGSFWWNSEWLTGHTKSLSVQSGKFWISVGDKETESGISHPPTDLRQDVSQVVANVNFVERLRAVGAEVDYRPFSGGHDLVQWKEELPEALTWLYSE